MLGLERLHYFNGQRLVAKDFELEQRYHMRIRRLLNRGLYSPGVIRGLEVTKVDARHVRVSNGIALDPRGREIILLADATLVVPNRQPSTPLPGYFLVIQYDEEREPGHLSECREGSGTTPPSRIREAPVLSFTETWPNQQDCGRAGHASDCAVVLALVGLDASCQITTIDSGVRQYAHSEVPRQVNPFALEGEKDIDPANPKRLHFQIRGGPPSRVLLYLWAGAISSLFYTELGSHSHKLTGGKTGAAKPSPSSSSTDLAGNTAPLTGGTPYQARGGPAYSYPSGLRVKLDGTDITGLITAKLGWAQLGDGTPTHPLATNGTGSIDLIELGLPVAVGPHLLEFRVPSGGGKVFYNLYVE
jgi:hypothetical protein